MTEPTPSKNHSGRASSTAATSTTKSWLQPGTVRWFALGLGTFLLMTTVALTVTRNRARSPRIRQPISFSHRLHVQELEVECSSCHEFYEIETFSGLPNNETCSFCHDEPSTESAEEEKLLALLERGPLEWRSLFRQPPHVFFSHRRHAGGGGARMHTVPRRHRRERRATRTRHPATDGRLHRLPRSAGTEGRYELHLVSPLIADDVTSRKQRSGAHSDEDPST